MEKHYNAFISYRHHPVDIRVASEIHRALERYRLPRALRRNAGLPIHIFRDKDELPITSDLSNDIQLALQNSDFLIVICSTHTHESLWVQREIREFLMYHDRRRILTVLVDGEPVDTIPDLLKTEERVNPETGLTEQIPVEPLSCDWRLPRRKAHIEELPRLMAALLQCSYAELRQRERHYRMQRLTAAISLALAVCLCFMGYFVYANRRLTDANVRVETHLTEALRNQSRYLSGESMEALDDGDRQLALKLALEALPEYPGQRPYTPEAEYALNAALNSYTTEQKFLSVGAFNVGSIVRDFLVTEDGKTVYISDRSSRITVWDGEKYCQLGQFTGNFYPEMVGITAEGNLIANDDGEIVCLGSTGQILWKTGEPYRDAAFMNDRSAVVLLSLRDEADSSNPLGTIQYSLTVTVLDADTGEELQPAASTPFTEDGDSHYRFAQLDNPAGPLLLLDSGGWGSTANTLAWMDPETGVLTPFFSEDLLIFEVLRESSGDIFLTGDPDGSGMLNGRVDGMATSSYSTRQILRVDGETGEILWKQTVTPYFYGYSALKPVPDSSRVLACFANLLVLLDGDTGELLGSCEVMDYPVDVWVGRESARYILENGRVGIFDYTDHDCSDFSLFTGPINRITQVNDFYLTRETDDKVTDFRFLQDENELGYQGPFPEYDTRRLLAENRLLIFNDKRLWAYDCVQRKLLWTSGEFPDFMVELLGTSGDGSTLWCSSFHMIEKVDLETGEIVCLFGKDGAQGRQILSTGALLEEDILYVPARSLEHGLELMAYDTGTEEVRFYSLEDTFREEEFLDMELLLAGNGRLLLGNMQRGILAEMNPGDGSLRILHENVTARPWICRVGENRLMISMDGRLELREWGGDAPVLELETGSRSCISAAEHNGYLMALMDDGHLCRYSSDGAYLQEVRPHLYDSFYSSLSSEELKEEDVQWYFTDDGYLVLNIMGMCTIIHEEEWKNVAIIENTWYYNPALDEFIVLRANHTGNLFSAFRRYSLEEQMEKARELLVGYDLTEDQRQRYGLMDS